VTSLLLVLGLTISAPSDTTVSVARGTHLVVETPSGDVSVRVWERDAVRIEGRPSLELAREGSRLRLVDRDDEEGSRRIEATLTVPVWMDLTVQALSGDVRLTGTRGRVEVLAVSGEIVATDVAGQVELVTLGGDIRVRGASGSARLQSTGGSLEMSGMAVTELSAETTDGDVEFEGRVPRGARLRLATHDGDVTALIPESTEAEVSVATFDGSFEPGFPVRATRVRAGQPTTFVLGGGGATLDIRAFDGDIRLLHTGTLNPLT